MTRPELDARARRLFGAHAIGDDGPDPVATMRDLVVTALSGATPATALIEDARSIIRASDVAAHHRRKRRAHLQLIEARDG